ncbi:MAG: nuclear transport factor 2 family protein [Ilumatobacter sp.]|uniref:nuclear transport factor 2 family protein n=1 Tax=Ilumatobacter sp. TaxID=1967498 RepID=UPI00391940D3
MAHTTSTSTDTPAGEHPNATKVRQAHEAFKTGDMDTVREIFDWDNIRWVLPGSSVVSGVDTGMEEVFANFGKCHELTDGTYSAIGFDYMGSDHHAVALAHLTARRGERTLEMDEAVIFTIENGKFVEAYHLAYDQYAWDAFFD